MCLLCLGFDFDLFSACVSFCRKMLIKYFTQLPLDGDVLVLHSLDNALTGVLSFQIPP